MKEIFDQLSADCSRLTTKLYSTSFSYGIYFLGKELRQPIHAIYGFVRLADEIVDSFHHYNKKFLLEKFKEDTFEAIKLGISLNPILNSFQKVVNKYRIDQELIVLFLRSMEMDLSIQKYTSELYNEYILGSAEVVGLMCLRVFTYGNDADYEQLKPYAMKLGAVFQKVNFLRDVKADHQILSRNYFPNVNLALFCDRQKKEIEAEIEAEFDIALAGIKLLPTASRNGVYLSYIYYKKLFTKIKRLSAEKIMTERIRISNTHKIGLMFDSIIRNKLNVI
ncbi:MULTISPECIES: phytoene/squalene synthase family protein [unclassified Pedobacter]|uniref:phytoene/squalene synthase family protein n=1 Tax=unclassified Pedobacter TaxID=2628915 RepID=UPI00142363B1|nr:MULTISPECIES: squalene/phytoene synthase family protein [unclassified Pedobacter]NII82477.1 phytoene/squalene synthetase [Pedobacter sp. SG908]NMN36502.1 phytoene/squalene synthetase [Pedobacter sp. SG918]